MLIFTILVIGFSGLIAQVLLLRELLVSFYGNELTVGIILANWVFLEAMGALLLGRLIDRVNKRLLAFGILNILFIFSLILSVYLTRSFKVIFSIPSGLGLGIDSVFWSSFLILLPVSFFHGGLFSFCVKIYAAFAKYEEGKSVGRVYFWESIGTIIAGIIFTYFFIPYLNSFQVVFIIVFLNFLMLCLIYRLRFKKIIFIKDFWVVAIILLLFFLIFPVANWLQNSSIRLQWRNYDVQDYSNSIYGNVVVTKQEEQYTFFLNGLPAITTPYPDLIFVQEFAQLPLLFHPNPRKILFISGGVGGLINTILKHPNLLKIDYVELDPLLIEKVKKYPTELTRKELSDRKVRIINLDGRFYVKRADARYDIIFLGIGLPADLQTNRLFTEEFFKEAKEILEPEGILTFTLPGSLTYLSQELTGLNSCILNSLDKVFRFKRVIPGDFNLFLASDSSGITKLDSSLIIQRIRQRKLESSVLLPTYVEYRLNPHWVSWFNDSLGKASKRSNIDFSPYALFKTLSLWNAIFSPRFQKIFLNLERVNLDKILKILFIFCIFSLLLFRGKRRFNFALPYAIVSTGFFGMLTNMIIIFCFQIVYGYLYYQIAILITLFMIGAALGSILISRYLDRIHQPIKLFVGLEAGIILWIFIVLFIILSYPLHFIFFILCIITGLWVGMEFPLANKIYLVGENRLGTTVGVIYAADLFGGWFAAIFSGILFLPLLGLTKTFAIIFTLKLISFILLLCLPSFKKLNT